MTSRSARGLSRAVGTCILHRAEAMPHVDRPSELSVLHSPIAPMDPYEHEKRPVAKESLRRLARGLASRDAGRSRFHAACPSLATLGHVVTGTPA